VHATLPFWSLRFSRLRRSAWKRFKSTSLQVQPDLRALHVNAVLRAPNRWMGDDAHVLRYLEASASTRSHHRGAPELNPHFRELVASARALGTHVIDRCNLTVLEKRAGRSR